MKNKKNQNISVYSSDCHVNIVNMYTWVVIQAFMDYASNSTNRRMEAIRKKACEWIMKDNEGFDDVCAMAELSTKEVRENFLQLKNNECDLNSAIQFVKRI